MTKIREGYKETEIGVIPEDWEVKSLSSISENKGEYGIGAKAVDYQKGKPRYLRITDIDDFGRLIEEHEYKTIAEEDFHSYILQENDLVFARTGNTTGKTYLYNSKDGELVFAGFLIKFSIDSKKASSEFVRQYCFTKRYWDWVKQSSTRSGQPGINSKQYGELILPLPPLPEQQRIAGILSTADNHIEKLDKIIEYYQLLKKGIMKKLLTEGIGHTEFKETEIGRIPKEWEVVSLSEITSLITKGTTPSTYGFSFIDKGVNFIKVENITQSGNIDISLTPKVNEECHQKLSRSIIKDEDILVSIAGTIGRSAIINECHLPANTNQAIAIVRLKNKNHTSPKYINYTFSSSYFTAYIDSIKTVGAQPNMSLKQLNDNLLALPKIDEQIKISLIIGELDNTIENYRKVRSELVKLKNSIMEQLLTGKIRTIYLQSGGVI